jgi:MFS family permease
MPMMFAAIVASIVSGQLMARTGRYKLLVVAGFAAAALGAYLLSRMTMGSGRTTLWLDTAVMGLGLGVAMSAFTTIVQNQYPVHRLGEVSASLQFFRMIGSTVGLAIFGSVLNNQFTGNLTKNVPVPVVQGLKTAKLDNANALGSDQAQKAVQAIVGKAAQALQQPVTQVAELVAHGLRLSLEQAINTLFVVSTFIGLIGLLVVLFLPEVRLRASYSTEELQDRADEGLDVAIAASDPIEGSSAMETE